MRKSQILAGGLIVFLTASAGLAWRHRRADEPRSGAVKVKQFSTVADRPLMRTPSNDGIPPVPNRITISNRESETQTDRPTTISRFFAAGEVPAGSCATAVIDGSPVPTQCDAKTHWPDGSLQHALLTFKATIGGNALEVSFAPSETTLTGPGLDVEGMLSTDYDFSAVLEIETSDGYQWVNVREMLKAGMFRYWIQGPLVTQVIVEERGVEPGQDFLGGGQRTIHPIFILTFYQGHRGVRVEAVSEIAWLKRLPRLKYSAWLWTGAPGSEEIVYELKDYTHIPRTRWRRDTWSGPALGRINVNHNLPYMVYSRILPNFDLSRSLSSAGLADELKYYKERDNFPGMGPNNCSRPGGSCMWFMSFGTTGGRPDIGVLPRWDVRYLYTFDPRLYDVMIANANVSGHVPIHLRENAAGRVFHSGAETAADANSRVLSIDARPCYISRDDGMKSCDEDKPAYLTPKPESADWFQWTQGNWYPDTAHQGSFAFVAYLVTGDWYYLEELYFWASWNIAYGDPGNCEYCRGGDGDSPGIYGVVNAWTNIRAIAWGLRAVAHSATLAPDGSPEKGFFTEKVLNNIAAAEGRFSIRGGLVSQSPEREGIWQHGFRDLGFSLVNPFYSWWPASGNGPPSDGSNLDPAACANWTTAPMQNFIYTMFGYVDELGFPATVLRQTMLRGMLNQLANPDYNRYLVDEAEICNGPKNRVFHKDWKAVLGAFKPATQARKSFQTWAFNETELGYGYVALAVASFLGDVQEGDMDGRAAHKWLAENYPSLNALDGNPKWALVPRSHDFKGSVSSPSTWSNSLKAGLRTKGKAVSARAR